MNPYHTGTLSVLYDGCMDTETAPTGDGEAQDTLTSLVLDWYREHPGLHRPLDVARALDITTQQAASTSRYLWRTDRIQREGRRAHGRVIPRQSIYGIEGTT